MDVRNARYQTEPDYEHSAIRSNSVESVSS